MKNFIELGISWDTIFGIGTTIAIAFFLVLPFVIREREFYDRARRLPIDSYLAILKSESKIYPEKINIKTVYLSGGHRSGWQEKVKSSVKKFNYLDTIISPNITEKSTSLSEFKYLKYKKRNVRNNELSKKNQSASSTKRLLSSSPTMYNSTDMIPPQKSQKVIFLYFLLFL